MFLPSILLAAVSVYTVSSGTKYTLQASDPHIGAETVVNVEAGGVLDMNALSASFAGITGAGVVSNGTATLSLADGPYRFSGRYYGTLKFAQGTTPDAAFGLVIGNKYTLDGATVWEPTTTVHPLRFAKNVGRFRIGAVRFATGPTLTTEDEAGLPIDLVLAVNNSSAAMMKVAGCGNLYLSNGFNLDAATDLTGLTGKFGLWKGRVYQNAFAFPASLKEFVIDRSLEPCTLASGDPLTRFQFENTTTPLYLTADVFTTKDSGAGTYPMVDIDRPIDFLGRLRIAYLDIALGANCTNLTFRHGYVGCGSTGTTAAKNIDLRGDVELGNLWLNTWGDKNTKVKTINPSGFAVSTAGSTINVYRGAHYAHTMYRGVEKLYGHPGSTLSLGDRYGRGCAAGTELHLDGCTLRLSKYAYTFSQIVLNDENANMKVCVGANRVRIYTDMNIGNPYQYPWTFPEKSPFRSEPGLAKDGGVEFYGGGRIHIASPWLISGPFRLTDARVILDGTTTNKTSSVPITGTGDIEMANACLVPCVGGKLADESRIVYEGSATIEMRQEGNGSACTVTMGRSAASKDATFVRRGRGVLTIGDNHTYESAYNPANVKAVVNGGLTTQSNGRIPMPIFTACRPASQYSQIDFATIDADSVIGPFTGYTANDFTQGAASVVRVTSSMTLSTDATVAGLNICRANLTIADGKTIAVANGSYPSVVLCNNNSGSCSIYGSNGTIAFGSREGIFMIGQAGYGSGPFQIYPKITGSGGVTFSGTRIGHRANLRLFNANTYTGGTWINCANAYPRNDNAFSTGDVHLGDGRVCGGRIMFEQSGVTIANRIIGAGFGPYHNYTDTDGTASLIYFGAQGCSLTGPIELTDKARFLAVSGISATIEGSISGARLQLLDSGATFYFTGANVHTGGTEVIRSTLVVADSNALGRGDVMIDGGILRFENAAPITVTNRIWGVGTIQLAGAEVDFTGIDSDPNIDDLTLDVAGGARRVNAIDQFDAITNSAGGSASLTVTATHTNVFTGTLESGIALYATSGAVIDFNCRDMGAMSIGGDGTYRRGQMTLDGDIEPGGSGATGTLRLDPTPTLGPNARLIIEVGPDGMDKLTVADDVDISGVPLVLKGLQKGMPSRRGTILECGGARTGEFPSVTKPKWGSWTLFYLESLVNLRYAGNGLTVYLY